MTGKKGNVNISKKQTGINLQRMSWTVFGMCGKNFKNHQIVFIAPFLLPSPLLEMNCDYEVNDVWDSEGENEQKHSRSTSIYPSISSAVDLQSAHTKCIMTALLIADPLFMSFTKPCLKIPVL